MSKPTFRKPPKTQTEREKYEDDFVSGADKVISDTTKQNIKPLLLRLPEPLWKDLKKLAFLKETSMTSICIDTISKKISRELNK